MSLERALLRRVKVLLECSNMEPLQRQTDLIVGEIKELLAQPESTAEAIMPNGVCVSNVYDAYEEGRKSVMSEQEPVAWMQDSIELYVLEEKSAIRGYVIPLYTAPPHREPLSDGEIRDGLDGKNGFENWYDDRFVDGVRFAEKHHIIGGGE